MSDDVEKFVDDIWKKEFDEFIANDAVNRHIKTLQQELDQHKNNWEELKKWLEQEYLEWKDCEDVMTKNFAMEDKTILNKMKELEEKNNA